MKHARAIDAATTIVLPLSPAPRRGLSCEEAAAYIGLSQTKFLKLVDTGKMPKPIRIDRRVIWDMRALDSAFDQLRDEQSSQSPDGDVDDGWGDEAP